MTVGERIKYVREQAGISQVDFAVRMNVSKQTLYKYENNIVTNIPSDKIETAAKYVMYHLHILWDGLNVNHLNHTKKREITKK